MNDMNRDETLNYLFRLRQVVAPVAQAELNEIKAMNHHNDIKNQPRDTILIWGAIVAFLLFLGWSNLGKLGETIYFTNGWIPQLGGPLPYLGLAYLAFRYAKKKYHQRVESVTEARQVMNRRRQLFDQARSDSEYQYEAQYFPQDYYNYPDIYRLWELVANRRADSLKEAINLLEVENFQEKQLALQRQMNSIQADIAESARATARSSAVTAAAATATAVNTANIASNTGYIARKF